MGALKLNEVTNLYPFEIVEVKGKITPHAYHKMIKQGKLPLALDTHREHDLKQHINPTLKYINEYNDVGFMERVKEIVDQAGSEHEKIVDYVTFELVSGLYFSESAYIISKDDITDIKTMSLISDFFFGMKLTEDQIRPRWFANLKKLQILVPAVKEVVDAL